MNQIQWDESFSVGIAEFDRQHKQIIDVINTLLHEPQADTRSETLSSVLQQLMTYSRVHFQSEERFLAQQGFPFLDRQHREHLAFEDRLMGFIEEVMARKPGVPGEVLDFLKHWWVDHIMIEDMEYRRFLTT